MSNVLRRKAFLISSLALAVTTGNAVAGGFEKATMWDAKYSALGGAAVSSVDNSSAIFFNPAGLARVESNDISLHVSPTLVQANGPIDGHSDYMKGEKNLIANGGFTGAYRLNEQFVLGYGIFGSGGASAAYEDVTVGTDHPITGDYSTEIKIIEAAAGLGYQINNNWSVGGSYRLTYAYADINIASAADVNLPLVGDRNVGALIGYNDMSGLDMLSVRLGAMYRSDNDRFGWGLNYRSEVNMKAEGKYIYKTGVGTGDTDFATAKTSLPMQLSTGIDYQLTPLITVFGEITYTNYSANDNITFETEREGSDPAIPKINTNWEDQYNYRIAAEYTGIDGWALRAGYVYTTAVVPEEYAVPTFSTPAGAHTYTFGAGTSILNDRIDIDMAAEYNRIKNANVKGGGVIVGDEEDPSSVSKSGRYDSKAWAVHVSARYNF